MVIPLLRASRRFLVSTPPPLASSTYLLQQLEEQLQGEMKRAIWPTRPWLPDTPGVHSVAIVGGGQAGLAVAAALLRRKIDDMILVDAQLPTRRGPWKTIARMRTLQTPKEVPFMHDSIPSLSLEAWAKASFGQEQWDKWECVPTDVWSDYLTWFGRVTGVHQHSIHKEVENVEWDAERNAYCVTLKSVSTPIPDLDEVDRNAHEYLATKESLSSNTLWARNVVLATGRDRCSRWRMPELVVNNISPALYWHSYDPRADIEDCRGKRVGILGAGTSALENAVAAAKHGAKEVKVFCRRSKLERPSYFSWARFHGFLIHYNDLPDEEKIATMTSCWQIGDPPSPTRIEEAKHAGENQVKIVFAGWNGVEQQRQHESDSAISSSSSSSSSGDVIVVTDSNGEKHVFDHLILATGQESDLASRADFLRTMLPHFATWGDARPDLIRGSEFESQFAAFPYLTRCGQFMGKEDLSIGGNGSKSTPTAFLSNLISCTHLSLVSNGMTASGHSSLRYGTELVANAVTRNLFLSDWRFHANNLRALHLSSDTSQ